MPHVWHSFHHTFLLWAMIHRLLSGSVCVAWYGGIVLVWRFRKHYPRMSGLRFDPKELIELPTLSILGTHRLMESKGVLIKDVL